MRIRPFFLPIIGSIILVILFIPELFLKKVYFNGDMFFGFYPTFFFYKQQILTHQSFLWIRSMLGGFPLYLDPSGGFYSPVHFLLFKYFSVYTAYALALLVGTAILFWLTYFCARVIGISRPGSFLAALVYSFGYQMLTWSNNLFVVNALYSLPLLFLAITYISRGKWYWSIIGGLGVGFALFTGQPQWVLMSFVAGGFYIVYLLWQNKFMFSRENTSLVGWFILLILIVFAVAAYQVIPINQFASLSSRAQGLSWHDAQINGQTPLDWIRYIIPEFDIKYLTTPEPIFYIGIIPLILGLFGLSHFRKDKKIKFFVFLFLFGLITSLKFSPIFWLLHQLPFFNYFRGSNRWMYVGHFGLAMLTGVGFDMLRDGQVSSDLMVKVKKWLSIILAVIISMVIIGNVLYHLLSLRLNHWLEKLFDQYYYPHTHGGLPLAHYHEVIQATTARLFHNIDLLNWRFVLPLIFLGVGIWFLKKWQKDKSWVRANFALVIIGMSALNLLPLNPNFMPTIPRILLESKPYFISVIQNQKDIQPYRMFSLFGGSAVDQKLRTPYFDSFMNNDVTIFYHDLIFPAMNMLYDVDSFDGLSNLMPRRNSAILSYLGSESTSSPDSLVYKNNSFAEKLKDVINRLPLFSAMNIKYITSAYTLPPTSGLKLLAQTTSTRFNIPIYLYENQNVLPRVYLTPSVRFLPENQEIDNFRAINNLSNNFSKSAFIECNDCLSGGISNSSDSINIIEYKDGLLHLKAKIKSDRWLVFSESNVPGWKAEIDSQVTPIYYANYIFQAVLIPAGEHDVHFEFGRLPL